METTISFNPDEQGSPGLGAALERVFGAARWVHNRAMILQWEALQAGKELPTLEFLTEVCIDAPAKDPDTSWLAEIPRGVLLDELEELTEYTEDLDKFASMRSLPLKRKKDDQEMVYPEGAFNFLDGRMYGPSSDNFDPANHEGLALILAATGILDVDPNELGDLTKVEAVRIERTQHTMQYKVTIFSEE